ncbi:hypothetical protein B0H19DRAFT_7839 [Mycena capillaripes]|nr:hypothetical protein B0H19DRAFT_7839 [Mycena capillaripes]
MHRALDIPEVLQIICLELCPNRDCTLDKDVSRDLASLARTCTTLSASALDALWSFQDTILHVLDCMPPGIWKQDRSPHPPILPADWKTPLTYMYRVKYLSCDYGSFPDTLDLSVVFEILRMSLPTHHLFPNLRTLHWPDNSHLSEMPILLAPGITNIALGCFRSIAHLTLLSSLAVKCPSLTHVQLIQNEILDIEQSGAISSFVCGLQCLQSLDLEHLDQMASEHLAHLPELRTVTLEIQKTTGSDFLSTLNIQEPIFTALREVTLQSTPAESALAFISSLGHSLLESLDLDINPDPDDAALRQIHVALKRHLPQVFLTKLRITRDPEPAAPVAALPLTIETIRYLFHFGNLTSLVLRPPSGVSYDDDVVLSIAEAWPRLKDLSLWASKTPHRATLRSLFVLAQRCPNLARLEMAVNASAIPEMDSSVSRRILHYSLVAWEVAGSPISSSLSVARFLSGIFPKLTNISTDNWDEEDGIDDDLIILWDNVDEYLPICHKMREEERFWAERIQCERPHRVDLAEL